MSVAFDVVCLFNSPATAAGAECLAQARKLLADLRVPQAARRSEHRQLVIGAEPLRSAVRLRNAENLRNPEVRAELREVCCTGQGRRADPLSLLLSCGFRNSPLTS